MSAAPRRAPANTTAAGGETADVEPHPLDPKEPIAGPLPLSPPPPLVLGSASPRRLALLAQMGVAPAQVDPADIDETPQRDEPPRAYAMRMASEKAAVVAARRPEALVLAADTVVCLGRRILDKPTSEAEAAAALEALSGRRHRVVSAVALVRAPDGAAWRRRVETQVRFKRLSREEIAWHTASGDWRGKAGGYAIQGRAAGFVAAINGSYSNVVGLPLTETLGLLEGAGLRPFAPPARDAGEGRRS